MLRARFRIVYHDGSRGSFGFTLPQARYIVSVTAMARGYELCP